MRKNSGKTLLWLVNLALLAGVIYLIRETQRVEKLAQPPRTAWRPAAPVKTGPQVVTLVRTNGFHWGQLESEDYRTYITRLRAIGCPEETIRDIIISDLEKLMSQKVRAASPPPKDLKYWQPEERELEDPLAYAKTESARLEVDFEKRDIVHELLGVDLVAERAKIQAQEDSLGSKLAFLPDDKRLQVRKVTERFNRAELDLREQAWSEGDTDPATLAADLHRLDQQRANELRAVLTPDEWQQYDLRLSSTAYQVRDSFFGMAPSEDEYQKVFTLQKAFDERWAAQEPGNDAERTALERAGTELQQQLRQQLGETRYQEYVRAQDPDFRQITVAAVRNQVPREKALEAYDIKRIAVAQQQRILNNPDLSDEQRQAALHEIANESSRVLRSLLGDKGFNYLRRNSNAAWLQP